MKIGIYKSGGWWDSESDLLARANPPSPHTPDNEARPRALLVDRHGAPLITTSRRPLGFRPPDGAR